MDILKTPLNKSMTYEQLTEVFFVSYARLIGEVEKSQEEMQQCMELSSTDWTDDDTVTLKKWIEDYCTEKQKCPSPLEAQKWAVDNIGRGFPVEGKFMTQIGDYIHFLANMLSSGKLNK